MSIFFDVIWRLEEKPLCKHSAVNVSYLDSHFSKVVHVSSLVATDLRIQVLLTSILLFVTWFQEM